jgi:hypothetical protein
MEETPVKQFLELIAGAEFSVWGLVKLAAMMGLFLYIGFSVMIVRQVDLMSRALNGNFDAPLKLLAWIYLALTVIVFLLAFFLL